LKKERENSSHFKIKL